MEGCINRQGYCNGHQREMFLCRLIEDVSLLREDNARLAKLVELLHHARYPCGPIPHRARDSENRINPT